MAHRLFPHLRITQTKAPKCLYPTRNPRFRSLSGGSRNKVIHKNTVYNSVHLHKKSKNCA